MVVAGSVVVQAGGVVFPPGVLKRIGVRRPRQGRSPERLIRVRRLNRPRDICQRHCRPKSIRKYRADSSAVRPKVELVEAESCEDVCRSTCRQDTLLNRVQTIVESIGLHRVNCSCPSPPEAIVAECRRTAGPDEARELLN
jgi:hypothetical protein